MAGSNTGGKPTTASLLANRQPGYTTGRPTAVTDEVLRKLEEAFSIGASDKEACFYANIVPSTLYKYQESHPEFTERKDALKERPILLARQSVINGLANDPQLALKYLERKLKSEFSTKVESDTTLRLVQPIMSLEEPDALSGNNSNQEG